ncbi:response regulator transcription factor [Pedobacter flavus]|uniref:Response regulator transcription factor n=1 Tax=Pedobacter flavus TaxID=3113906 RepID=A0ABU7H351_9SPHI|nr:response regulator transcription factor [Pedobacter sp. VNH31]MEE1885428.1 response regulator transcription factor [Pedobacter sp. VNH31]
MNICIAEDNSMALKSIIEKLKVFPDLKIKASFADGQELLNKIDELNIDFVLMDIDMPNLNGIQTTKILKVKNPKIKIIALTTFDDDDKIFEMIKAGASGYLLKEESGETIYKALFDGINGGASMSPTIALKVLNLLRNPLETDQNLENFELTKREIEVLEQLKNGLSYNDIAKNLFISYGTVRKHIENIYRKLNVDNKVNAINIAVANRVIN